jgi:hypothetical protein
MMAEVDTHHEVIAKIDLTLSMLLAACRERDRG